ncbi:PadR family transcriptional regulator, partial [Staphylococcus aureus]
RKYYTITEAGRIELQTCTEKWYARNHSMNNILRRDKDA